MFIKIGEMPGEKPLRLQRHDRQADLRKSVWFICKKTQTKNPWLRNVEVLEFYPLAVL